MKRMICLLAALLLLSACAGPTLPPQPEANMPKPPESPGDFSEAQKPGVMPPGPVISQNQPITVPEIVIAPLTGTELFSDRDYEDAYDADASRIVLQGETASCTDDSVIVAEGRITITEKGTYILSGRLNAGMVIIDTDKKAKVQLVLENADIHSKTSAAIYVAQADKVFLTLAENTENSLSNGGSFVPVDDSNIDAAIFSRDDLTINGSGYLRVRSPAGHGIVSKDEVTITGGEIAIEADAHGITGEDCVCIDSAILDIQCGKDAIQAECETDAAKGFFYLAEGTVHCDAGDNGIRTTGTLQIDGGNLTLETTGDALHSDLDVIINGGAITVSTEDDGIHADNVLSVRNGAVHIHRSYEGLEAKSILVAGGEVSLISQDDGLNAAGGKDQSGFGGHQGGDRFHMGDDSCILISGGSLKINAAGDGMDSNGGLFITGGNTVVEGPADAGNGPLDYSGVGMLSGGILLATGSVEMAQSLIPQGQGVLFVSTGRQTGGTTIEILDMDGNVLLSACPAKSFACIVASCQDIHSGQTYRVAVNGAVTELRAQ